MRRRLVLTLIVSVVLLLLTAPAAQAVWVSLIDPNSSYPGQTQMHRVTGSFATEGSTPHFELRQGSTTIVGTTDSLFDATTCNVTFSIPGGGPAGSYALYTSQNVGGVLQEDIWYGAFTVVDTTPRIDNLSQGDFVLGTTPPQVLVYGANFVTGSFSGGLLVPGSMVYWNDTVIGPDSCTPTQITFTPPAGATATLGWVDVRVRNPNGLFFDGPFSNTYSVRVVCPTPHITYPYPVSAEAGSPATLLDVYGDTFFASGSPSVSTITWNGSDLPTTFVTATHLQALIGADRLAAAGFQAIRVRNGSDPSFAKESLAVEFQVTAPTPTTPIITGVSPPWATAGSPALPITISGTGFAAGAVIYWNSTSLPTTSTLPGQLNATVPASLLAAAGTANITVHNGTGAGAPVSAPWAFTVTSVTPGTPVVTSLSPSTTTAGAAAFPLTVNGSGFIASSVVVWAGGGTSTDLVTTFVSATQLTAQVPAGLIATAGTATITVRNGPAGSPVSGPLSFSITGGGGGGTVAVTSLEPTQVWAGYMGPGVTLTVNGSGFVSGAHIWLGTHEKSATTFVGATRLTTALLPADLASAGTIQVSVKNPGGAASAGTLPLAVGSETTDPTVTIAGADSGWHNSPVTLTFTGADSQSGVQKVQYRCPPAVDSWTDGSSYTVPVATQGVISVSAQAVDWCSHVGSAVATVKIDTTKPGVDALNAVSVKRGKIAKLRFRVSEPADLSPTATVVLQVKKGSKVVKTKTLRSVPMNSSETYSFKVNLKKGSYRWYISATDLAGNPQVKADWASFSVR